MKPSREHHKYMRDLTINLNPDKNAKLYKFLQELKTEAEDGSEESAIDRALAIIESVEVGNSGAENWAKLLG